MRPSSSFHGGGEDAEEWRPIAERLTGFLVVTYDRRGTLRGGRDDWPGGGSGQHADDAAGLLEALGLTSVVVFGASSAGIIAVELALCHPDRVRRGLVFEPGYFRNIPGGEDFQRPANDAVAEHLARHPGDWRGAYLAFGRAISGDRDPGPRGFFTPAPGKEWYAEREDGNAETLVRDDIPILTGEVLDGARLASGTVDIHFSTGTGSLPIFQRIAAHLTALGGSVPDRIDGVGHSIYCHPEAAASYIRSRGG